MSDPMLMAKAKITKVEMVTANHGGGKTLLVTASFRVRLNAGVTAQDKSGWYSKELHLQVGMHRAKDFFVGGEVPLEVKGVEEIRHLRGGESL